MHLMNVDGKPSRPTIGKHRSDWRDFTIVIPAHNEENYLPNTLATVQQSLQEIDHPAKVVVVNDASTDLTREVAIEHGAEVIDVSLRNIGAVRNAGARTCDTPWLFFLDADTLLPAATLAAALDQLAKGAAGGGAAVDIAPEIKLSVVKWAMFYAVKIGWQSIGGWAAGCFMFCRKDAFEAFGGFDEDFYAIEELFFSRGIASQGRFSMLRQSVVTSARKLEAYSTLELLRFVTLPIMQPTTLFKSKVGLELLYDDEKAR
ncbi:glycosyltransferase [Mariniblastus fucicola]|uniref:N-glycosyltransferase n=1 Tax=Mariniblastus fucicola TaxID=980251 RepID=A0A5B9PFT8_9BACT|nr:glycosyltransferase [Mariniblastus fucicola]QEG21821.1 N-glycosyltransferase [Mariniblastus fucicola]